MKQISIEVSQKLSMCVMTANHFAQQGFTTFATLYANEQEITVHLDTIQEVFQLFQTMKPYKQYFASLRAYPLKADSIGKVYIVRINF